MHCDYNIERYVKNKYFDYLKELAPEKRAAEKFRLETEALELEIKKTDEIAGWFKFIKEYYPDKIFPEEEYDAETKRLNSLVEGLNCTVRVDRGHTLLNYGDILNHGLVWYENKIDAELAKAPDNAYLAAMKGTLAAVKSLTERVIGYISENKDEYGEEKAY